MLSRKCCKSVWTSSKTKIVVTVTVAMIAVIETETVIEMEMTVVTAAVVTVMMKMIAAVVIKLDGRVWGCGLVKLNLEQLSIPATLNVSAKAGQVARAEVAAWVAVDVCHRGLQQIWCCAFNHDSCHPHGVPMMGIHVYIDVV
jgi:hypothetical protein